MATYTRIKKIKIGDNIFQFFMPSIKVDNINIANFDYYDLSFDNSFTLSSTAESIGGNDEYTTGITTIGLKLGYTTSGNNRAVRADSNGNLYVTQKDDNSNTFKSFYGTCNTAAATAAKVVTLSVTTGWQLVAGTVVGVKFTNTNTAANPTLNVNSSGAKSIFVNNAVLTTGNWYAGEAGRVHYYMYDGTYWVFMGHSYDLNSNTTYTAGTGLSLSSTTFSLATSGVTAGSYGPSANASPAHSGTFSVPYIIVDKYGRVTAISTKTITLPASGNTDAKVTQSATTTSDWRKVLVHYTTNTSGADVPASVTNQVYAAKGIEVQPSTGTLHAEALTTKKITPLITGGSQTAAVTTSPYKPALWKFNAGITPANGNIVVIQAPGGGHSYGEFLSLDNGTTYKPITHSGTDKMTTHYASGSPIALIYDSDWTATSMYPLAGGTSTGTITGGAWRVINGYLDGNTYPQAQCETAAATAAKTASMSNYTATANRYLMVNVHYANTAASAITLNVNGTGAKPIYINGSASSSSNYTLPAGSYFVYYNGTNYYFQTDGCVSCRKLAIQENNMPISLTITNGTSIDALVADASNNLILGRGWWAKNTSGYNIYIEGYETNIWGRKKIATNMAITQGSDKRLKKDIKDLEDVKDFVMDLKPVEFKYEFASDKDKHLGFIAQDVEKSMNTYGLSSDKYGLTTEITGTDNIQYKGLNYTEFIPICIKMIQEQQQEINALKEALNKEN